MSFIICACGHKLSDVSEPLPYDSGRLIGDDDEIHFRETLARAIVEMMKAFQQGQREEWLDRRYSYPNAENYWSDLGDEEIVDDLISLHLNQYTRVVDQCDQCGRLLVQAAPYTNDYRFFKPEAEWQGVLKDLSAEER